MQQSASCVHSGASEPSLVSRRKLILSLAASAAGSAFPLFGATFAQGTGVRVTRKPPVVTRHEFDPRRPPPNMPPLNPPEAGVCSAMFEIDTRIGYAVQPKARGVLSIAPHSIDVVTGLELNIFTVIGASARLREHEEAHREISEHFYERADHIAHELALPLLERTFDGTGSSRAEAERDAFEKAVTGYNSAYFARTRNCSMQANQRFDELTDHGRNSADVRASLERAIEEAS